MKELAQVNFKDSDQKMFTKQFKTFKRINKAMMRQAKKGLINLLYEEEPDPDNEGSIIGTWYNLQSEVQVRPEVKVQPDPEPAPDPEPVPAPPPIPQSTPEPETVDDLPKNFKEVDKDQAKKLFDTIRLLKPYRSMDFTSKVMDILLENDIELVDKLKPIRDNENPATYKQTKALYRIIFGRHYKSETYNELIQAIN